MFAPASESVRVDPLEVYLAEVKRTQKRWPRLSWEEERELGERIQVGDEMAVEQMVGSHLMVAYTIARDWTDGRLPVMDRIQAANIGLLEAARRFDPVHGKRFLQFAAWYVKGCLRKECRDSARTIRIPVDAHTQMYRVMNALEELRAEHGPAFAPEAVAERAGVSLAQVEALTPHLEAPVPLAGTTWGEEIGDPGLEMADLEGLLPDASVELDSRQRILRRAVCEAAGVERDARIVLSLFGLDTGVEQHPDAVAEAHGLTRERVRQIKVRVLAAVSVGRFADVLREEMRG